jgi:hypothetical protein
LRIYEAREERSVCVAPPALAAKYSVSSQHLQTVVLIRNKWSRETTLWNSRRSSKPQTFTLQAEPSQPASRDALCDFCMWSEHTAEDSFGRVENAHCVTAANLFCFRARHGLVLFRHHEALTFSMSELGSLLDAAARWFTAAHAEAAAAGEELPEAQLLWNAGARSGASQAHGHAQLLLQATPLPDVEARRAAAAAFAVEEGGTLSDSVVEAHESCGLVRWRGGAALYASLVPLKDLELCISGPSVECADFRALLHAALRTLIDRAGVTSFNVSIEGWPLAGHAPGGATARVVSRGRAASTSAASDFGALELFGGASIGHTPPWEVMAMVDAELALGAMRAQQSSEQAY